MSTILGCIADDFTGATDLAGLLARSGARVSFRIGVPEEAPQNPAPFEVVALKSRTAPVGEAIADALAALEWLQKCGATHFFWKYCSTFDSTAEGNIGPVAEALMKALGTKQTIYCPAFPENGRSIFMGNLFVGEQLLAESPMKDHPLTPMRDSNLMRLLEPQVEGKVDLVNRLTIADGVDATRDRLNKLARDDIGHVVMDAVANDDLKTIAAACMDMPFITGGSAVAQPLPSLYAEKGLYDLECSNLAYPETDDQTIILSGSCSAMTRAQVARYIAKGKPCLKIDPMVIADEGTEPILDWLSHQDLSDAPLIYASADPADVKVAQATLGIEKASTLVEAAFAKCALKAKAMGAGRFIVAGGETSGAVTKALGVSRLNIGREVAPGVPITFCTIEGEDIALVLKSGNFGAEDFFTDANAKIAETGQHLDAT